jgi:hypothetical protein
MQYQCFKIHERNSLPRGRNASLDLLQPPAACVCVIPYRLGFALSPRLCPSIWTGWDWLCSRQVSGEPVSASHVVDLRSYVFTGRGNSAVRLLLLAQAIGRHASWSTGVTATAASKCCLEQALDTLTPCEVIMKFTIAKPSLHLFQNSLSKTVPCMHLLLYAYAV